MTVSQILSHEPSVETPNAEVDEPQAASSEVSVLRNKIDILAQKLKDAESRESRLVVDVPVPR